MLKFKAARNAGISPVVLIKEPEAAAMYTLHYLKHQGLEVCKILGYCIMFSVIMTVSIERRCHHYL
jgi:short subunit fatty acids transporter